MTHTSHPDMLRRALAAWRATPASARWPAPTSILVCEYRGRWLAWPMRDGESFEVVDIEGERVVDDDEVSGDCACALDWVALTLAEVA